MICKRCYEAFCINSLDRMSWFETEEERERFFNKRRILRNGIELELKKISRSISEEEFEQIEKNKEKYFFLVLIRRYIDDAGFSKIEHL